MVRALLRIIALSCLLVGGTLGLWFYQDRYGASREIAKLQQQKQALQQIVNRLSDEKRVAELIVTDQSTDAGGKLRTSLLFVEYTRDGQSLPPRLFTIEGRIAHVDAMVIKFQRNFVEENDPLRGHSIALFTRIYGDQQSPASAQSIDQPGKAPEIYRDADPRLASFEQELWRDFWRLTSDEDYRNEKGVSVAMGQGVWGMFEPGKLYRITTQANGGLLLSSEPIRGIYREALKRIS